jgi:predicted TIM-barrel enzyme
VTTQLLIFFPIFISIIVAFGFFGASSIERLPTERAITGQVKEFKSLKLA